MPWKIIFVSVTYMLLLWTLITAGLHLSLFITNGLKFNPEEIGLLGIFPPYYGVGIIESLLVVFVSVVLAVPINYWLFNKRFKSLSNQIS
jgi:uncharacterized membrane protein